MNFYAIYAKTVNDAGQKVTLPPGTVERVIAEHPGADYEAMIEIQNSGVLTPGVDYGIALLRPKGVPSIVCVQRIELPDNVKIVEESGEFDLLGGEGDKEDEDGSGL